MSTRCPKRRDRFFAHAAVVALLPLLFGALTATAGFRTPLSIPLEGGGVEPTTLDVGDVNGDGIPDIVSSNYQNLTVLLGRGNGRFEPSPNAPIPVGRWPFRIRLADVDGDGRLDIITGDWDCVTVLLGDGSGAFEVAARSPCVLPGFVLFTGDFDGDGRLDLVTGAVSGRFRLFLGDGAGGFEASSVDFGDSTPVAVGDVNGDRTLDIVLVHPETGIITAFLGDGRGAFRRVTSDLVSGLPSSGGFLLLDADVDGRVDLVSLSFRNVIVALGDGTGRFSRSVGSPIPEKAFDTLLGGDINGDGRPDLVLRGPAYSQALEWIGVVYVLLGTGSGTFVVAEGSPVPVLRPTGLAILADVDGNRRPDILISNLYDNSVTVLLAGTGGRLSPAVGSPVAVGTGTSYVAIGDMNGDGRLDIVTANVSSHNVSVLLQSGDGSFGPAPNPVPIRIHPSAVAVGDLDGDGKLDLVLADWLLNEVVVLRGDGLGASPRHREHRIPSGRIPSP